MINAFQLMKLQISIYLLESLQFLLMLDETFSVKQLYSVVQLVAKLCGNDCYIFMSVLKILFLVTY